MPAPDASGCRENRLTMWPVWDRIDSQLEFVLHIQVKEDIMNIEYMKDNKAGIAVVSSDEKVITDVQSALDLVMSVKYETGAETFSLLIPKKRRYRN